MLVGIPFINIGVMAQFVSTLQHGIIVTYTPG